MRSNSVTKAIIQQCNEAILFAKRRQTTTMQLMAEEVLKTCSNIADSCSLIELNSCIQRSMMALEKGEYWTVPVLDEPEESTLIGFDLAKNECVNE